VVGVIELSQSGYRETLQNLAWTVGYNALAIPPAAGVPLRRLDLPPGWGSTSASPAR
jgi:cation transport ATPase